MGDCNEYRTSTPTAEIILNLSPMAGSSENDYYRARALRVGLHPDGSVPVSLHASPFLLRGRLATDGQHLTFQRGKGSHCRHRQERAMQTFGHDRHQGADGSHVTSDGPRTKDSTMIRVARRTRLHSPT